MSPHEIEVAGDGKSRRVSFAHCVIAAGSEVIRLPNLPDDPRIIDSTGALELDLPQRMYSALSLEAAEKAGSCGARGLTRRERQCLELAAQGKSDWVAGRILGISERTVHNHIEHAKRRLGVATRVQAIVHALVSRQIAFGDVIRSTADEEAGAHQAGRS